jgi:protein-L-isoaspartate(D-aspartate) O-methyltransferase
MTAEQKRDDMVTTQLESRGIADPRVLETFRSVAREDFLPERLREFAYDDSPLPIENEQTISQPYIVALTAEALNLRGDERVLEVGTGSGYAAAVLSRLAAEVYTVERIAGLAESATERLERLGYANVHVHAGDGTLGWAEHAPYDAIAVAAGGPQVPEALLSQLKLGGRLVVPVGPDSEQMLVRVTRTGQHDFHREELTSVRFVPLIGTQGWPEQQQVLRAPPRRSPAAPVARLVREVAEPFGSIDSDSIRPLLARIGDARVVLLGEATHGTSEFYRLRARISRELIQHHGFDFVAVEADWPDAARIDNYVLGDPPRKGPEFTPFARFPTWMWRNQEVLEFTSWLRQFNTDATARGRRVGFHGLDLYSLFTSIAAVLHYLDDVDPAAARAARNRYGALTPWQRDPAAYGRAVLVGLYESSETAVVSILRDLLERRIEYARNDGERFFDAAQNARLVANAERYYRAMYYGSPSSWNLRDSHMFDTLEALLGFYGPDSRGIVWEHNSHVGNAQATEMSVRGEHNVGQLCRAKYGEGGSYIVGFGTDHGTVAAASDWDEPMQVMQVRPAHPESYERVFHDSGVPALRLPLGEPKRAAVKEEFTAPRLERAIGVVYRPDTELQSHYFYASLARQFDELIWFDATSAVQPLSSPSALPRDIERRPRAAEIAGSDLPETYPFGL